MQFGVNSSYHLRCHHYPAYDQNLRITKVINDSKFIIEFQTTTNAK